MIKSKYSQITIFVIIAIVLVVGISVTFFLSNKPSKGIISEENPQAYIDNCISDYLEKEQSDLIAANFYPNRTYNMMNYQGQNIPYLCSVSQYYTPCVNQEPMLMGYVQKYLENKTKIRAEKCFSELIKGLKSKGYQVQEGPLSLNLELLRDSIRGDIQKEITTKRGEETKIYEKFSAETISPIYRLVDAVRNILNYESMLCEFNNVGWMNNYKDIDVRKFSASDQSKVYTVTEKNSKKTVNFAIKTCIFPAGI